MKRILSILLTLAMVLTLVPATALASGSSELSLVTQTVQPLDPAAYAPIEIAVANVVSRGEGEIFIRITGLPAGQYKLIGQLGSRTFERWLDRIDGVGLWEGLDAGVNVLTVTVTDSQNNPLFAPATLNFTALEQLELTAEDARDVIGQSLFSVAETAPYLNVGVVPNSFDQGADVTMELVKNGVVYAVQRSDDPARLNQYSYDDKRYDELFGVDSSISTEVQMVGASVYCGQALVEGTYDVNIYENGVLKMTVKDAARCVDAAVVEVLSNMTNVMGSSTAYCAVSIENGNPSDYAVQVWQNGVLLGQGGNYRVDNYGGGFAHVTYQVPLSSALESNYLTCKLVSKTDKPVFGTTEGEMYATEFLCESNYGTVGSHYFANFVLPTRGYQTGKEYTATLYGTDPNTYQYVVMSTASAVVGENGVFDVEFLDENGELIPLEPYANYQIRLGEYGMNSFYVYNNGVQRTAWRMRASDEVMPLVLWNANCNMVDNEMMVRLSGGADVLTSLPAGASSWKLKATSMTGKSFTLDCRAMDASREEWRELYFPLPDAMEDAYYTYELFCDGKLVVYSQSMESVLDTGYPGELSHKPSIGSSSMSINGLSVTTGITSRNLGGKNVTVKLFAENNLGTTADAVFTLTSPDYEVTSSQLVGVNSSARYHSEYYLDGQLVGWNDPGYWVGTDYISLNRWKTFAVTAADGQEDLIELIPCQRGETADAVSAFSEVYAKVTVPDGQELKYLTVNGKRITGRGFLVTENCEVAAVFGESSVTRYDVTYEMGYYNYNVDMTEEELEANGGRYPFVVLKTWTEKHTPDSWVTIKQPEMPEGYENYEVSGLDLRTADGGRISYSHNTDGSFSFTMPDGAVSAQLEMNEKPKYYIYSQYDRSMGTITGLPSESIYAGTTVTFTPVPAENHKLVEVYCEYYDYMGGGNKRVTLEDQGDGTYAFTMPKSYSCYLYVVFASMGPHAASCTAYGLGTVTSDKSEYMAGETVTLTVVPNEGSRLLKEEPISAGYVLGGYYLYAQLTKVDDTTYTFVMPDAPVYVEARFELMPAQGPGGDVYDTATLITALGGDKVAKLNEATGYVELRYVVETTAPINFVGGDLKLDVNGYTITGTFDPLQEESAVVIINEGAVVELAGDRYYQMGICSDSTVKDEYHGIWVKGGNLTVSNMGVESGKSLIKDDSAAIQVDAGTVVIESVIATGVIAGDGLRVEGGAVTASNSVFHGGCDENGEFMARGGEIAGEHVTRDTLGGNAIFVSGTGALELIDCDANGGANAAALRIREVDAENPGEINVYNSGLYPYCGTGLWVEDKNADLELFEGTDTTYAYSNTGAVGKFNGCGLGDFLAPNRIAMDNYGRYPLSQDDLKRTTLYSEFQVVLDSSIQAANEALDGVTSTEPEEIKTAVEKLDLETALKADDGTTGTVEKLAALDEQVGTTTTESTVDAPQELQEVLEQAQVVGAAINAAGNATLVIGEQEGEQEAPAETNTLAFSLTLKDETGDAVSLTSPIVITMPVPAGINPALLTVHHYNESTGEWEDLEPTVIEKDGQWFVRIVAASFSDFAMSHQVAAEKVGNTVTVTLDLEGRDKAASGQQFLCAAYSQTGKMLGMTILTGKLAAGSIELHSGEAAYVRVFTSIGGDWAPLYGADTVTLS